MPPDGPEPNPADLIRPDQVGAAAPKRTVGGYDRRSVDELLARIGASYRHVWDERDRLAEEVQALREQVGSLERESVTASTQNRRIRSLLLGADAVTAQLRETARHDGELALRKAQRRADRITSRLTGRIARQREELAELERTLARARSECRELLLRTLMSIENMPPERTAPGEIETTLADALRRWRGDAEAAPPASEGRPTADHVPLDPR